jgi:hypothetical protein
VVRGNIKFGKNAVNDYFLSQNFRLVLVTDSVAPEPEGSSPHSQQPASGPYPEPGESTAHPLPADLPKVHFDPILPSTHLSLKWYILLPSPMRATCRTHLILLDLICLIISGKSEVEWETVHWCDVGLKCALCASWYKTSLSSVCSEGENATANCSCIDEMRELVLCLEWPRYFPAVVHSCDSPFYNEAVSFLTLKSSNSYTIEMRCGTAKSRWQLFQPSACSTAKQNRCLIKVNCAIIDDRYFYYYMESRPMRRATRKIFYFKTRTWCIGASARTHAHKVRV